MPPTAGCAEKRTALTRKAWSCVHVISSGTESSATPCDADARDSSASSPCALKTTAAAPAPAAAASIRSLSAVAGRTPTASTIAPAAIADRSVES